MKFSNKFLNPFYLIRGARNRFWFWVARQLRYYLAHTPWITGDPAQITIGRNVVLSDTLLNCRSGYITIEDNVFFGHNVMLLAGTHDARKKDIARQLTVPSSGHDITIRRGAWVTSNVIVIGPCEIGEYAVIAAGSIVTGYIAPGTLYAGDFAKSIKRIEFD